MGSNAQRRREQRDSKVAQMRKAEAAREKRSKLLGTVGLSMVVVVAVAGVWWAVEAGTPDPTPDALDEVKTYDYTGSQHTDEPVDYTESPPVGGEHNPIWLACDLYDEPIPEEKAVHSLEHGAVWVTYDPALPQEQVDELKSRLDGTYLMMSPYEDQDAPVVATAWNNQLALDGVDDPRLDDFITEFRQGPQTPEPGASCDDPQA